MISFAVNMYEVLKPYLQQLPVHFSLEGSIVAMFLILYGSKFLQVGLSFLLLKKYDNVQNQARYGGNVTKTSTWQEKTVQRAYSAHSNHWEAFTAFSIAVLLAVVKAPGQRDELTMLANAFVHVRIIYNVVYILAFNEPLSAIRSSVWTVGWVIILRIFTIAIGKMTI